MSAPATTRASRNRALVAAALAVGGVCAVAAWTGGGAPVAASAVRFAAGTTYEYDLAWDSRQSVVIGADADARLDGAVVLRGRLIVHGYGRRGGAWLVGVSLAELATHDVVIQGQAMVPDAGTAKAMLATGEALVELRDDGAIDGISFGAGDPELFQQLASALLAELDFRTTGAAADGGGWRTTTAGPFGTVESTLRRDRGGVRRARDRYTSLVIVPDAGRTGAGPGPIEIEIESSASLVLAPEGHWRSIADREHVRIPDDAGGSRADARVELTLTLAAVRPGASPVMPPLAGRLRRPVGVAAGGAAAAQRALAAKVDGLTRGELLGGVESGVIADEDRWFWRASGLVEADPAIAAELGERVAAGTYRGRAAELALDLLAAGGTPEAQAALRVALAAAPVRAAENYGLLVQRLSLVAHPTAETAAFAIDLYQGERAGPAAYALGAVARHLADGGDGDGAARCTAVLATALDASAVPAEQAVLLGALGNAALVGEVPRVLRFTASTDAGVRASAARALRHTDTPEARAALHELFADPAVGVQREVIGALADHAIGADDLAALERHVGAVRSGNENALVSLAASRRAAGAASEALMRAIAARPSTLPELRARIETLLARAR
jgi:hypothetical protein